MIEKQLLAGITSPSREIDPDTRARASALFANCLKELKVLFKEEDTGLLASEELAEKFAEALGTAGDEGLGVLFHLAMLLGKDVTKGDLLELTWFFGKAAGSGPHTHRNVEAWVNSLEAFIHHQPEAPRTTSFADLWSLNGRHPDFLIFFVAAKLAEKIALVDPDLVIAQSASLARMLREGYLDGRPISEEEQERLMIIIIKWKDLKDHDL